MHAALVGALAIGLSLGLLGSGGSILTVPVLHYLLRQPEQVAIGGSLLVVGLIATAACIPYAIAHQVDWRNVLWFGLPGMLGAWLGASLARWVPGPAQLALFALVMLVAAWRMLLLIAAIGVVGSLVGNRLGRRLPQASLHRLFGIFLVVMGLFVAADAGPRLMH